MYHAILRLRRIQVNFRILVLFLVNIITICISVEEENHDLQTCKCKCIKKKYTIYNALWNTTNIFNYNNIQISIINLLEIKFYIKIIIINYTKKYFKKYFKSLLIFHLGTLNFVTLTNI